MAAPRPLFAGIELGGSKCVCILGSGPEDMLEQIRIPTTGSEQTLAHIVEVLDSWELTHGSAAAIGIASFGPLDLQPGSPTFGRIVSSVKPGWDGAHVLERLARKRGVPARIDTDVNAAALAEGRWGAARGLADFAYITVGTGVGAGLIVAGRTVQGCHHPELGHIRIARRPADRWPGNCPYHGDCLEGLASGPAIAARTGLAPGDIPADSPEWDLVAHALAQLAQTLVLSTAPRRILVGGGILQARPELLAKVRACLVDSLNGYLRVDELTRGINEYIVPPGLGALAGPLGALALAADAHSAAADAYAAAADSYGTLAPRAGS